MISAGELTAMRATVDATLPDRCAILRLTQVPDGAGGWVDTFADVATVRCRVRPAGQITPIEQVAADRLQGRVPFSVTLSYADEDGDRTDVTAADRVVAYVAGGPAGDELEVIGVPDPLSWQTSVRLVAAKAR